MTLKSLKETDRFIAESEDREQFTLIEYTEILDAGHSGDPNATIPGLKRLETSEGQDVNYLGDDRYEIVELGLEIKRIRSED